MLRAAAVVVSGVFHRFIDLRGKEMDYVHGRRFRLFLGPVVVA